MVAISKKEERASWIIDGNTLPMHIGYVKLGEISNNTLILDFILCYSHDPLFMYIHISKYKECLTLEYKKPQQVGDLEYFRFKSCMS